MSYLSAISKIFGDGDLKDVFIESGIVSEGSIKGVLSGKHYNRSVRCHKIMYEVMERLRFEVFLDTMSEEERIDTNDFFLSMAESFPNDQFHDYVESPIFQNICSKYNQFVAESLSKSKTFGFWIMYIKMSGVLLQFIRATRVVDWDLHLSTFRAMLPWFFACDRINYARYGSAYWLEMIAVETAHPGILHDLSTNFAVQRQSSHGFSAVACDQTIEKTANCDSKTKGGLVGFSMNRGAVHRWLMSPPERAAITRQCKYMAGIHSVSSGVVIEDKIADIILEAENLGEEQFSSFVRTNLMGDIPDIFAKIKRNNICSFSSSKTKIVKNSKGKEISLKTSRDFFARLLVIAKSRDVILREVLSYSLGVYPLSLSTPSGSLVKTTKSKLFEIVENLADKPEVYMKAFQENVLIVDAMAILQTAKGKWTTFGELADGIFKHLLGFAKHWNVARIDFVVDRYPSISIKNTERSGRAEQGVQKIQIFNKEQKAPKQWKKYMGCGENKESFLAFLCDHWSKYQSSQLFPVHVLFVTSKEICYSISAGASAKQQVTCEEVPELHCNHEEADMRLLLHANYAANVHQRIIIKSSDNDVFLLCIAMQHTIHKELFMMTGTGNKFRCVPIKPIVRVLGENLSKYLPGFHAFTGCDSNSSFYGKGKVKAWKVLQTHPRFTESFSSLGRSFPPPDRLINELNKYVCLLYGDVVSGDVDECRYQIFKTGKYSDDALPPNRDTLWKHIERANYQSAIWNNCLAAELQIPSPVGNGWEILDGQLTIVWMTQPPAPDSLLDFVSCKCKTGCKSQKCSCLKADLQCTELCLCVSCQNCCAATGNDDEDAVSCSDTDEESDSDVDGF
eukprot:gene12433-13718_t